jgi:hypothetical protein
VAVRLRVPVPAIAAGRPVPARLGAGLACLVALLAVLAGCTDATGGSGPTAPSVSAGGPGTSRGNVVDKLDAIAKDECETQPAAQIYPRCARFAREVANVAVAARSVATGDPEQAAVQAAAGTVDAAVDRLTRDGCLLTPNQGASAGPQVCGPDLVLLQDGVRALRAAFGPPA